MLLMTHNTPSLSGSFDQGNIYGNPIFYAPNTLDSAAFLIFKNGFAYECEGMVLESGTLSISSGSYFIKYLYPFDFIPGIFGLVKSVTGGDPCVVTAFNRSTIGNSVIIREDFCHSITGLHSNTENIGYLIIGQVSTISGHGQCGVTSANLSPTVMPTIVPTCKLFTFISFIFCHFTIWNQSIR